MGLRRWTVNAYTDTQGECPTHVVHRSNQGHYWTRSRAARQAARMNAAQATADTIFDPGWIVFLAEHHSKVDA